MQELYTKWWKREGINDQKCESMNEMEETSELSASKVGGVFLTVGIGLVLAIIMVIIEFIHKTNSKSRNMVKEKIFFL